MTRSTENHNPAADPELSGPFFKFTGHFQTLERGPQARDAFEFRFQRDWAVFIFDFHAFSFATDVGQSLSM